MPQIGKQWRSLDEYAERVTPRDDEFPPFWDAPAPDRRETLKLMAAAFALSGLDACSDAPEEHLIPAVKPQPDVVSRSPNFFATAFVHEGLAAGVLVKHWMGRPIKVEGNPRHPASLGATDAMAQAQLLDFYDPQRSWGITRDGLPSTLSALERALADQREILAAQAGAGFVILTGAVTSPTLSGQLDALRQKNPGLRWIHWEPISRVHASQGAALAYGRPAATVFNLANADVVLAIESDLLSAAPGSLRYVRDFASRRNPTRTAKMNRLYAVESTPSLMGAAADHRFVVSPHELNQVIMALAAAIFDRPGPEAPPWLVAISDDLKANRGRALIHVGPDQASETHALVFAMNEALGARGSTYDLIEPVLHASADPDFTFSALVDEMNAGTISSLVIIDSNPVYTAPGRLHFPDALKRVRYSLTLTAVPTETSDATLWAAPMAHPWESWSDARAFDGTASILQPQALPLYGGLDPHRLLALLLQPSAPETQDAVRVTWKPRLGADFETSWRDALAEGVIPNSASAKSTVNLRPEAWAFSPPPLDGATPTLLLRPDPYIWDGCYAGNAWLQELPRPLTKMTWDNPVLISPGYASRAALRNGDIVEIAAGESVARAPICISPGQADDCIVASLGFGRRRIGTSGAGGGVDFFPLLEAGAHVTVRKLDRRQSLASTDHHQAFRDAGGRYARSDTLASFTAQGANPSSEEGPFIYRWTPKGPAAWAMSIDLNACIGCGACVVACQAENNIPVVGREEVLREREMHWLRIDRYYEGTPETPSIRFQPVLCMHCEQAPCEPVCPVGATMHDSEGLNVMVYNRCIGTRFCSNNCPYKVRRFNYLAFADSEPRAVESRNPDVSVRARGVMEKCTFCIQRIAQARIEADKENKAVAEIETACQAACPTRAFTFGNLADAESEVAKRKQSGLTYALLADQNTVPRVTYEKRILNENPRLVEPQP
ncbi:Fe-S cluster-containing hydrogenase [Methylocystis sp. MJC1]|nr:Fe-S cluster-containing hydrogenase [Methylocystis sp. MJC1]KAF2989871.1 Tetrathionate reductase subunit B [Methylocystis sp. MJC1]MBU6528361.1 Fe-S cluster-containing hydrogenase [Methylocystis sp. MJC1]UZX11266.1 Fe-S cluster-containing hydrogenase [Methylocystis sp. MJC1]